MYSIIASNNPLPGWVWNNSLYRPLLPHSSESCPNVTFQWKSSKPIFHFLLGVPVHVYCTLASVTFDNVKVLHLPLTFVSAVLSSFTAYVARWFTSSSLFGRVTSFWQVQKFGEFLHQHKYVFLELLRIRFWQHDFHPKGVSYHQNFLWLYL